MYMYILYTIYVSTDNGGFSYDCATVSIETLYKFKNTRVLLAVSIDVYVLHICKIRSKMEVDYYGKCFQQIVIYIDIYI